VTSRQSCQCHSAAPIFGIKAKLHAQVRLERLILPRPFLESRQSKVSLSICRLQFCRAHFWNQGKATNLLWNLPYEFCRAHFWNQGKASIHRFRAAH